MQSFRGRPGWSSYAPITLPVTGGGPAGESNVHDSQAAAALIRDDDHVVYGDSGYPDVEKQAAVKDDPHLSTVEFRVNKRPKSIRENTPGTNWEKAIERGKSRRWLQSQGLLFSVSLGIKDFVKNPAPSGRANPSRRGDVTIISPRCKPWGKPALQSSEGNPALRGGSLHTSHASSACPLNHRVTSST